MNEHQQFEAGWWGDCANTYGEETKQSVYATLMGLPQVTAGRGPCYDLAGASVVDLGGGPVSMLLKAVNFPRATVVDPCPYPDWVASRYWSHGVTYVRGPAEEWDGDGYDEAWIYNVLQHVVSPERVVATARRAARLVRVFEWLETPPSPGHPHTLHAADIDGWLGGRGQVDWIDRNGCVGICYSGVFPT